MVRMLSASMILTVYNAFAIDCREHSRNSRIREFFTSIRGSVIFSQLAFPGRRRVAQNGRCGRHESALAGTKEAATTLSRRIRHSPADFCNQLMEGKRS
jgi:hypothetical protein